MRTPRWITNLAGAECSLSHSLPDTMGAKVDYDDDMELDLKRHAQEQEETKVAPAITSNEDIH